MSTKYINNHIPYK